MTINDLLLNNHYRGNQTLLAKDMSINRGTLRKYMNDTDSEFHYVKITEGNTPELFVNLSNKGE